MRYHFIVKDAVLGDVAKELPELCHSSLPHRRHVVVRPGQTRRT